VPGPTGRLLVLLELLQGGPALAGPELAARLEVDGRTLRRDVERLQDLGIPVVATRGRYGGYRLLPGYRLPPLMLTDGEAVAIMLGLSASRQLGLMTGTPGIDSALMKLRRVLPALLSEQVVALEQTLAFTWITRPPAAPDTQILLRLGQAITQKRAVQFAYRSWRGENTTRELEPYALTFHQGRWYLNGHDERRNAVRVFRVDRIGELRLLDRAFTAPEDFDPVVHIAASLADVPYRWAVEVLLETTLIHAQARLPPALGSLRETADGVLFSTRVDHLDSAAQILAGLSWPFVIQSPPELIGAVHEHARHLAAMANRKPSIGPAHGRP